MKKLEWRLRDDDTGMYIAEECNHICPYVHTDHSGQPCTDTTAVKGMCPTKIECLKKCGKYAKPKPKQP